MTLRRKMLQGLLILAATIALLYGAVVAFTPVEPTNLIPAQYARWFVAFITNNPEFGEDPPLGATDASIITPSISAPEMSGNPITELPEEESQEEVSALERHIHEDLRKVVTLTGGGTLEPVLAERLNAPWLLAVPGFLALGILALGNVGWARDTQQHSRAYLSLFQCVMLGYLLVVMAWQGGGERLFYPVLPQIYLSLFLGIAVLPGWLVTAASRGVTRLRGARTQVIVRAGVGVFVAAWLMLAVYRDLTLATSYETWGDLRARSDPILAHTPREAILLSDWPSLDYMLTERRTLDFPPPLQGLLNIREFLRAQKVDYIVTSVNPAYPDAGIAPLRGRAKRVDGQMQDMVARGELEPVYSGSFPIYILRVAR
jgi:hypothetical protein